MVTDGSKFKNDASTLARRLASMYDHWLNHRVKLWGACNAFAVVTPPKDVDRYSKSSALCTWLFGIGLPRTLMVFSDKQIHFLCSGNVKKILEDVKIPAKVAVEVVIHEKQKTDDWSNQMDTILQACTSIGHRLGHVKKPANDELSNKWFEKVKSSEFKIELCDITNGLADLFAVKDASELTNVRIAASLTASAMKLVFKKLELVISQRKEVTHSSLASETDEHVTKEAIATEKVDADKVAMCYPAVFQSGGKVDLTLRECNNDHLNYGPKSVIICALGYEYNCYCTHVSRSILIDPNPQQMKAYQVLLKAHKNAISAVKPGNKASDVYNAACTVVKEYAPELFINLKKSAGTGIGLELCESGLNLTGSDKRILKPGMVLNVSLGFENLQTNKGPEYALLVGDIVIVTHDGKDVVTTSSTKAYLDVKYHTKAFEEVVYPFNVAKDDINLVYPKGRC